MAAEGVATGFVPRVGCFVKTVGAAADFEIGAEKQARAAVCPLGKFVLGDGQFKCPAGLIGINRDGCF